jgi:hypothetical protein
MKLGVPLLTLAVACTACLALPTVLAALTAAGLTSLLDWRAGLVLAALVLGAAMVARRRRQVPACVPAAPKCGCIAPGGMAETGRTGALDGR